jgi:hypothetical protein
LPPTSASFLQGGVSMIAKMKTTRTRTTASTKGTAARKRTTRAAAARPWILPGHIPPKLSHPKLQKLAERMASGFELAIEKVVAHLQDPKRYPLPSGTKTTEHRLRALVEQLPATKRRELAKQIMPRVEAGKAERERRLGDLAKIDLRSKQSVVEQLKSVPLPDALRLTQVDVTAIKREIDEILEDLQDIVPPGPAPELNTLLARVLEVRCVKTADVRKDKITLTGLAVDNLGNAQPFGPINLGEFKDGKAVPFPGPDHLQVATFDITQGDQFPKEFSVFFTMIEGRQETIDAIVTIITYIALVLGPTLMAAGLVVALLGQGLVGVVLMLVGLGFSIIGGIALNLALRDTFGEAAVSQLLEGLTRARADAPGDVDPDTPRTLTLKFRGGEYKMDVNFALVE